MKVRRGRGGNGNGGWLDIFLLRMAKEGMGWGIGKEYILGLGPGP